MVLGSGVLATYDPFFCAIRYSVVQRWVVVYSLLSKRRCQATVTAACSERVKSGLSLSHSHCPIHSPLYRLSLYLENRVCKSGHAVFPGLAKVVGTRLREMLPDPPAARGSQGAGFTQPRIQYFSTSPAYKKRPHVKMATIAPNNSPS